MFYLVSLNLIEKERVQIKFYSNSLKSVPILILQLTHFMSYESISKYGKKHTYLLQSYFNDFEMI